MLNLLFLLTIRSLAPKISGLLMMMVCRLKVLEILPRVLGHVALFLRRRIMFLSPDLQQTAENVQENISRQIIKVRIVGKPDIDAVTCLSGDFAQKNYLMCPICKMNTLKQKRFLTRFSV